jgi:hypothetical protein
MRRATASDDNRAEAGDRTQGHWHFSNPQLPAHPDAGDRAYFTALHRQIADGGAEAMFHELQRMPLGDWHPREIPASMLHGAALQKQQSLAMPPLEQWYLGLLHDGVLPGASAKRPNFTLTSNLRDQAKDRIPRLRWDLTDVGLANFLDEESGKGVGNICTKARTSAARLVIPAPRRSPRQMGPHLWPGEMAQPCRRMGGRAEASAEGLAQPRHRRRRVDPPVAEAGRGLASAP